MPYYESIGSSLLAFYTSPSMFGVIYVAGVLFLISMMFSYFPNSKYAMILDMLYEKVFVFYESILGKESSLATKTFIVSLFFIICLTNLLGLILDFIAPIFWVWEGVFLLVNFIRIPSADLQFNIALALVSIALLIFLQFSHLGARNFLLNYIPIYGKNYLSVGTKELHPYVYYVLFPIVKVCDVLVSFFLSFLDLVGLLAKVVSLSFRLFGNIVSAGVLLTMMIVALGSFTMGLSSFIGGINFPIVLPLLLYIQSWFVALIQAMVFPLLVAIFIKVSQYEI